MWKIIRDLLNGFHFYYPEIYSIAKYPNGIHCGIRGIVRIVSNFQGFARGGLQKLIHFGIFYKLGNRIRIATEILALHRFYKM